MIAVSLGDPAGIGPEVLRSAFRRDPALARRCILFGDPSVRVPLGRVSRLAGALAAAWLEDAARAVLRGEAGALVTGPVNKESISLTVPGFRGQTEFIARVAGVREPVMMLAGPTLRVVPVTRHMALVNVRRALSTGLILRTILTVAGGLRRWFGVRRPVIGVCGLNPHAGDGGILGTEDRTIVAPAVRQARRRGIRAVGPLPADAAFALGHRDRYDAVVAMYHDQAMIPIKAVEMDRAVNATLGLPFLRTSPAHGTAFDIAGRGIARPDSMIEALRMAVRAAGERP
ncbi:MAG: 4-hydroxythreonine-4-phosphate dehydrogenase PdxA [Candidatus Coatesbacteria bacterium]